MASNNTARRQRAIQKQVARADKAHPKAETKQAMQAGARPHPAPPFPRQHQRKPGSEAAIDPRRSTMHLSTLVHKNWRIRWC